MVVVDVVGIFAAGAGITLAACARVAPDITVLTNDSTFESSIRAVFVAVIIIQVPDLIRGGVDHTSFACAGA